MLDAPPYKVAEVVDGTLYIFDRPAIRHTIAGSSLGNFIGLPFQHGHGGLGGWWILDEPQLHLDEDIVVPDIAGWRRERMPVPPDAAYITLVPDWVCEVLSPSTRKFDLGDKSAVYARAGVSHILVCRLHRPITGSKRVVWYEVGGDCHVARGCDSFAAAI